MSLPKKLGKSIIPNLEKSGELVGKVQNINPAYFIKRRFIEHITYYCSKKAEKIIKDLEKKGRFIEKTPGININPTYIFYRGFKERENYYYL